MPIFSVKAAGRAVLRRFAEAPASSGLSQGAVGGEGEGVRPVSGKCAGLRASDTNSLWVRGEAEEAFHTSAGRKPDRPDRSRFRCNQL